MAADRLDISRMDGRIVDEIMEYMEDNNVEAPTTVYEGLDMFLRWNGIIGYTSLILRAVQELQDAAKPAPVLPKTCGECAYYSQRAYSCHNERGTEAYCGKGYMAGKDMRDQSFMDTKFPGCRLDSSDPKNEAIPDATNNDEELVECDICGKEFDLYNGVSVPNDVYCSNECARAAGWTMVKPGDWIR